MSKQTSKIDQDKKKQKIKRELRDLLIKIGVIGGLIYVLITHVICITVMHGNNMYPSIKDGDLVISYRLAELTANSAVVYKNNGETNCGRIVATEGHEVDITNEGLLIDDSLQYEKVVYDTTAEGTTIDLPYTVPAGNVFVLNDFRSDASDSRTAGAYQKSEVKGKIVLVMRRRDI